jgi:FdrA protein
VEKPNFDQSVEKQTKAIIKKGHYYDSVTLMLATRELTAMPGIEDASIVMATKENLAILKNAGMLPSSIADATDNDLVIVVRAEKEEQADAAIHAVDQVLRDFRKKHEDGSSFSPRSFDAALQALPDANLSLISVAGKYAVSEARKALDNNLHVMLFSDNVSLEDELMLKTLAHDKGLLMMGPDCGTAIINGIPLAFANVVKRGNIGLVGASGTGLQEVTTIISNHGGGISQAIGTGGRDLHEMIGGMMFIDALRALAADEATEVICLVSKPPHPTVLKNVSQEVKAINKPVIAIFIGTDAKEMAAAGATPAKNLEEAALLALAAAKKENPDTVSERLNTQRKAIEQQAISFAKKAKGKYLRGLFSGGTLCDEAQLVMLKHGIKTYSNTPIDKDFMLEDPWKSCEHTIIDLGTDEFTAGRPHPMIDFSLRNKRIIAEANHQDVAVILLDVVLGYGAHLQPAEELVPAIEAAKASSKELLFVCSITGTADDPQDAGHVKKALENAGVIVMPSMAAAAELCAGILNMGDEEG